MAEGVCISAHEKGYNPIMLLAREGEKDAVSFLMDKFQGSRHDAIVGYAIAGQVEEVNEEIDQGGSQDSALYGYARGGHFELVNSKINNKDARDLALFGYAEAGFVEQVNVLLHQGGDKGCALQGYACGGYVEQVNALIKNLKDLNRAVYGYAMGGHLLEVTALIKAGADSNHALRGFARAGNVNQVDALKRSADELLWGYAKGGHIEQVYRNYRGGSLDNLIRDYASGGHIDALNQEIAYGKYEGVNENKMNDIATISYALKLDLAKENILRLMTFISNEKLRESLAKKASVPPLEIPILLEKAARRNKIMNDYQFKSYKESESLTLVGARAWLLQGPQLINEMTLDTFWHITNLLLGLSTEHSMKVFKAVYVNLFNAVQKPEDKLRWENRLSFFVPLKIENSTQKGDTTEDLKLPIIGNGNV